MEELAREVVMHVQTLVSLRAAVHKVKLAQLHFPGGQSVMGERAVVAPMTFPLHIVHADRVFLPVIVVLLSATVSIISHLSPILVLATALVFPASTTCVYSIYKWHFSNTKSKEFTTLVYFFSRFFADCFSKNELFRVFPSRFSLFLFYAILLFGPLFRRIHCSGSILSTFSPEFEFEFLNLLSLVTFYGDSCNIFNDNYIYIFYYYYYSK